jgi:D-alanine-D-alanine ligase
VASIESQSDAVARLFQNVGEYATHEAVKRLRKDGDAAPDDPERSPSGSRSGGGLRPAKAGRVLLVTHPEFLPPDDAKGPAKDGVPWQAEQDVVWGLRCLGYEVDKLGVLDDLVPLEAAIKRFRPHVVFNLLEEFDGVATYDQNVVSYLECLGVRYTGAGPKGLLLARDKPLAKTIVAREGVRTPPFTVVRQGRKPGHDVAALLPAIVKSASEDASLGIAEASVVRDVEALEKRVAFVHEQLKSDALVERFIDGDDVYVGVVGNHRLEVYPPRRLRFPDGGPRLATRRAKWDDAYRKKHQIASGSLGAGERSVEKEALAAAKKAFEALALNGYARLDFRLDREGKLYFLEANPNPHLGRKEDFAASAQQAGLSYSALLQKIVSLGLRWRAGHE